MRDGRMQNRQNPTRPTNTNANRDARMQPTHRKPENWLKSQLRRRPLPVWVLIVTDILLIGISLLVFAYFHHVRPKEVAAVGISSSREAMAAYAQVPAATELPQVLDGANAVAIAPTATPQSDPVGYFGTKYADKFTDGDVIRDGLSYKSEYLNITIHENFEYNSKIYVCDFYVKDISCLRTEFGKEKYGQNINEALSHMTARVGSISSINGDYYSLREDGAIIRNGVLYRDDEYTECDMCVLYWDGTMKTFEPGQFDAIAQMEAGAYQSWTFGPRLLDDEGNPKTEFNATKKVQKENPRTAIGYFEPGHYCFIVVDGREDDTVGITLADLAQYMASLGCKAAYNLDGGKTSQMYWGTSNVNEPYEGGRNCSDMIYLAEPT